LSARMAGQSTLNNQGRDKKIRRALKSMRDHTSVSCKQKLKQIVARDVSRVL
jgi:hypothetical protein